MGGVIPVEKVRVMSTDAYDDLTAIVRRYAILRRVFNQFYQRASTLRDGKPLKAVLSDLHPQGYFDVSGAGTRVRFLFGFRPESIDLTRGKGVIRCFRLNPLTSEAEDVPIGESKFEDSRGDIGLKFQDGNLILISNEEGARHAVAHWVLRALIE
jgi:hypothetical protein